MFIISREYGNKIIAGFIAAQKTKQIIIGNLKYLCCVVFERHVVTLLINLLIDTRYYLCWASVGRMSYV